jgi:hypothetical protein
MLRGLHRLFNAANAHKLRALVVTIFVAGIIPAVGAAIFNPDRLRDWWSFSTETVDKWQFGVRWWIAGMPAHKEEEPSAKASLSSSESYLGTRKGKPYGEDEAFLAKIAGESVTWDGFVASISAQPDGRIWITTIPIHAGLDVDLRESVACVPTPAEWDKAVILLGKGPIQTKIRVSGILAVIESGPGFLNDCKVERIISRSPE